MRLRFRPPMFVVAAILLGLIALLATLQYRWLGQISAAERERMKSNLAARSAAFALDFDRELTRAYLTFQTEPVHDGENLAGRLAQLYDRWQADSRYPRLLKDVYVVGRTDREASTLQRFNAATRFLEPAEWPDALAPVRAQLTAVEPAAPPPGSLVLRAVPALWDTVPALVVPSPVILLNEVAPAGLTGAADVKITSSMRYTVLALDREYLLKEMLPALAQQHFRGGEDRDYQIAVVSNSDQGTLFTSAPSLKAETAAAADASTDLFQVRVQEFGAMASDVRRFTSFIAQTRRGASAQSEAERRLGALGNTRRLRQVVVPTRPGSRVTVQEAPPLSIMLHNAPANAVAVEKKALEAGVAFAAAGRPTTNPPRWRLVAKHPAGSLETAVANARRRNLFVSSGILAVLGVSIGFLVVSTRRSQDLARQQMEFVAAVSHELRTPLAVIRSAADNLAEGVVHEHAQVRRYGELVRGEGRRLSEMVEQILELSGIHSGQRGFALRPVAMLPLVHDVVRASAPLIADAGMEVEYDIPETLPPVLGDEQALRRVVQNLVGNAIKYGASGGWLGIRALSAGGEVQLTVADRGIGIAPAEQGHIFEPFYRAPSVIEAQIQGAGLGLSLVHRIVEAHGGRIAVRSAPGSGSEFTVHLPAATEEPAARTTSAPDAAASVQGGASA